MKIADTLSIPGYTIAYKTAGNPINPPIIALHGWLDNANSFDNLAAHLQENYYLIAIDLPGHGHSSHLPLGHHYHITDAVLTIIQIINTLTEDKVHLLGHSMGACLVSLVAGIIPSKLRSLFLIEGLGPFSSPEDTACDQLIEYLPNLKVNNLNTKGYNRKEAAALARAAKGYVSLDIAKILCERGIEEKDGNYYWRHDRRLLMPSPLRLTEKQILSFLKAINVRTCLLLAENGFSFNSELMQNRVKSVKDLEIIQLKGGHHIHMEQPEIVAKIIVDFLGDSRNEDN